MEILLPYHNYIVTVPNGNVYGFVELDEARDFTREYYIDKVDEYAEDIELVYDDSDHDSTDSMDVTADICRELGVYEGQCKIFELDNLIEVIRDSGIFEDEKEELIMMLMEEEIDLNVNDYHLEEFLEETKEIPTSDD